MAENPEKPHDIAIMSPGLSQRQTSAGADCAGDVTMAHDATRSSRRMTAVRSGWPGGLETRPQALS